MKELQIRFNDDKTASVVINGVEISSMVSSLRLDMQPQELPRLSVELIPDTFWVEGDAAVDVLENRNDR